MKRAYSITYLGPTHTMKARLAFENPMGKRRFIERTFGVPAETQALSLALVTPGFIEFAPLRENIWIYIAEVS